MTSNAPFSRLHTALTGLRESIVCDVPVEMAKCEFDCGKAKCSAADWTVCEGRKAYAKVIRQARETAPENASA